MGIFCVFLLVVHHVNLSIEFQARRVAAAEGGGLENMFIKIPQNMFSINLQVNTCIYIYIHIFFNRVLIGYYY